MSDTKGNEPPSPTSIPPPSDSPVAHGTVIRGIAGSPGVAVGPALVLGDMRSSYARRYIHSVQIPKELDRVREAIESAKRSLKEVSASISVAPSNDPGSILDAYMLMLGDPLLIDRVEHKIRAEKKCAEWAVATSSEEVSAMFGPEGASYKDPYLVERRHDVEFVCDRLLRALVGDDRSVLPRLDQPMVIVARDLSPADTASMVREPVIGFITEIGTRTSHTSIMARALEIPAVVGAGDALSTIRTGDIVVVDGLRGEVTINPTEAALEEARGRGAKHLAFARGLLSARDLPSVTKCGEHVSLRANVELPAEAILALDHGAEGIGLYRTEFIYIDRISMPTEDEQYELYRAVVEAVSPRPVTLRTFDIGGDKFASSFQLPPEMNPALGLRAVRLALKRPDVLMTQLRAMVRASAHGHVRIMIPMVASLPELREVKRLLRQAIDEVDRAGHPRGVHIPIGIMIEVPAAVVLADLFAKEAEFFSLGTNDLVQYALAIDRTNRALAPLATPFHPAIVRMIHTVVTAGKTSGIGVSICGAMASDPLAAMLLIGLGLRDLSMEAAAIPEIKEAVRRVTVKECERVAEAALELDTAERVEQLVASTFAPTLYDLLSGNEFEATNPPTWSVPGALSDEST